MNYKVKTTSEFDKKFKKLDKHVQKIILKYIKDNLYDTRDPFSKGKKLKGNLKDYWRYRILDYRLICKIVNNDFIIILVNIGHRKKIYK